MAYALAPSVSFCHVDGRIIVLDRRRDRYVCLTGDLARCLHCLADGSTAGDAADAERLIAEGILVHADHPCRRRPATACAPVAETSALEGDTRSLPTLFELVDVGRHLVLAGRSLRRLGLERTVGPNDNQALDEHNIACGTVADVAARFEVARRVLSRPDRCLRDSVALRRKLSVLGLPSTIVFGVRSAPFKAHCWVQHGGLVLNETVDGVHPFTPILVVR